MRTAAYSGSGITPHGTYALISFHVFCRFFFLQFLVLSVFQICEFELVTYAFELVIHGFEHATCAFELVTREFELVTPGFRLLTRGFELATLRVELVTSAYELVGLKS